MRVVLFYVALCFRWVTFLAETSKDLEIILIIIVLRFTNSLPTTSLILALRQVSFIQTSSIFFVFDQNEKGKT